jgi:hypothetical protein
MSKKQKTRDIDEVHPCDIIFELLDDLCSGGMIVSKRDTKRLVQTALQQLANAGYRLEGMGVRDADRGMAQEPRGADGIAFAEQH